jgi:hypothetical protein
LVGYRHVAQMMLKVNKVAPSVEASLSHFPNDRNHLSQASAQAHHFYSLYFLHIFEIGAY